MTSFETEEYLQMCAVTDDGEILDNEVAERLFSLSAEVQGESSESQAEIISSMKHILTINKTNFGNDQREKYGILSGRIG